MSEQPTVKCARCGRRLKHPKFIGTTPYGSTCIKKVMRAGLDSQIKSLRAEVEAVALTEQQTDIINT